MSSTNLNVKPPSIKSASLSISYIPVDRLIPDPRNARQHSAKQIRQIAKSIETFGFNVPILVDAEGNVIAGHGRVLACKHLGWTEAPTIRLDHLTHAQKQAFMIADNRLAEVAVWDDRLLGEQLKALASVELDFDIETIGFDMGEIDLRIESLNVDEAKVNEPPIADVTGPDVSCVGDLWMLGRHKILCGDARDPKAHGSLMGTERAAAAFADPPFNVAIDGHVSGLGQIHHREFVMGAGEMTKEAFTQFLEAALARMTETSKPGSVGFVCMDWRHMSEVLAAAQANSLELLNLCVWTKPNAGMGSLYRSQHELVFVFKLGVGRHRNNVQLGKHGRHRTCRRGGQVGRAPSHGQADRHDRRRHPRCHATRRHRAGPVPRQRRHADGLRAGGTPLPRARTRPALLRRDRSTLAGLYRRGSTP
jgi:hypothetical protein